MNSVTLWTEEVWQDIPTRHIMASQDIALEYLATTKIGKKGQLTVPKQFRQELGLGTGAPFAVLRLGDGLILLPEQQRFNRLCEEICCALTSAGVASEAIMATLPDARKRIFARRYGKKGSSNSQSRPRSRGSRRK